MSFLAFFIVIILLSLIEEKILKEFLGGVVEAVLNFILLIMSLSAALALYFRVGGWGTLGIFLLGFFLVGTYTAVKEANKEERSRKAKRKV